MKVVLACLLLVAAAQAVEWANVRPITSTKTSLKRGVNSGRVIGGNQATAGQFPYQVGLFVDGTGFCGGSLIKEDVVLTAAHCAAGSLFHEVHAGAQNIYDEAEPGRVIVTTFNHQVHEDYRPLLLTNDLALVKLDAPISGPNIGLVRLPSRGLVGETLLGEPARSSGWGRVSDSNPNISTELKYVDVSIIGNPECASFYGPTITSCHVCIDTAGGASGVCNGDSGGPLTITESDGEVTQVGITSFVSSAGCEAGPPHGYCRVTCYLDWLETNAGVTIRP